MMKIVGSGISHKFNRRVIFKNISFEIESGSSLVITGANGSGKTTLVRIISQLIRPTQGSVSFIANGSRLIRENLYRHLGLVGPYLQLYNDLTALENYSFFARIRGEAVDLAYFAQLMKRFGLQGREMDELKAYSSGMLQRAKYVMALLHRPQVLILDEPTSNLDEKGAETVYSVMEEQKKERILILATNEPKDLQFGDYEVQVV